MDFLAEQHIVTGLVGNAKEEVFARLTEHLARAHDLPTATIRPLLRSVMERERQVSTCLGMGLAVPHGEIEAREPLRAVMGLSRIGLPFETPDGQPVHCVVLIATPADQRARHLQVLATIARRIGTAPAIREALYQADDAAQAWAVLDGVAVRAPAERVGM